MSKKRPDYSKGPWHVYYSDGEYENSVCWAKPGTSPLSTFGDEHQCIADVKMERGIPKKQTKKITRMVAKAPEMYELLKATAWAMSKSNSVRYLAIKTYIEGTKK